MAIALLGCNPIETYRSLKGVRKNDPDPQTAPFTGNMAAAQSADYPNLATVPPPPSRATSTAERKKLTEKLVSEGQSVRTNTTATPPGPIVAPTLPPPPAFPDGPKSTVASVAAAAPATDTAPVADAAPPDTVAEAATTPKSPSRNRPESGRRQQGEPPEPGPQNSNLQTPELAALPDPEAVRPPPAAPSLAAAPTPSAAAPLQPPPAAVAAGTPQPAPPPAPVAMPPPPPPPSIGKGQPQPPPTGATLASIALSEGSAAPGANDRELIERIAGLYKDKTDTFRVIGYAAAPSAGADPLDSYRVALDRAQAVAKMLGEAGMPTNRIQTEATPGAGAGNGRVEIQLVPMTTAGPVR